MCKVTGIRKLLHIELLAALIAISGFIICMAYAEETRARSTIWPDTIEIFTDSVTPIRGMEYARRLTTNPKIAVYNLDKVDLLESSLNKGLPDDPQKAKLEAQKRLRAIGEEKFKEIVKEGFGGMLRAEHYKLTHYPAIVFNNGESVVYGVHNIQVAIRYYREWAESQ